MLSREEPLRIELIIDHRLLEIGEFERDRRVVGNEDRRLRKKRLQGLRCQRIAYLNVIRELEVLDLSCEVSVRTEHKVQSVPFRYIS